LPGSIFQTALRQHRNCGDTHCRSLDRLHLAAMEELGVSRLMTHDVRQARAAVEAGFEVVEPR
jgi:predicted nucleic acid-binding protein